MFIIIYEVEDIVVQVTKNIMNAGWLHGNMKH